MGNSFLTDNPKDDYTEIELKIYNQILESLTGISIQSANKVLYQVMGDIKVLALITPL